MFAGIDIGSLTCKAVIFDGEKLLSSAIVPTGSFPRRSGESALQQACGARGLGTIDLNAAVCTGYGRKLLPGCRSVTEITCCAKGARFLVSDVGMVIDIGGQDSKVILVDASGSPTDFLTNDKCAAGTGRFFETIARALEMQVDEMASRGHASEPVHISSTCGIFAESEVVGLLAQGADIDRIIAGINASIAERTATLVHRLGPREPVVLCGGVARNAGFRRSLESALKRRIVTPEEPQIVAALGAALIAAGV